jgi:hypothetical protein
MIFPYTLMRHSWPPSYRRARSTHLRGAGCVEQIDGDPCLLLSWIEERAVGVAVKRDRRGYGREPIERALPYSLNAQTR